MEPLHLTGMLLKEAKNVLSSEGILDYDIVLTSPPRLSGMGYSDESRVVLARLNDSRLQVLVCNSNIKP